MNDLQQQQQQQSRVAYVSPPLRCQLKVYSKQYKSNSYANNHNNTSSITTTKPQIYV